MPGEIRVQEVAAVFVESHLIWLQLFSSALIGAFLVSTAGWSGPVFSSKAARFKRGFSGEQIGIVESSTPLQLRRWDWGWRLLIAGFLLQVVAALLQRYLP